MAVFLGDAQQLRDDRHRQGFGEVGDEIDLPRPVESVDQAVDHRLDPAPHRLDGPSRERLEHQPPDAGVIRRLEVEHPGVVELVERCVPGRRFGPAHLRV